MASDRIIVGINGWGRTCHSRQQKFRKAKFQDLPPFPGTNLDRGSLATAPFDNIPLDPRALMTKLYDPIVRVGSPLIFTDIRSAEIIKYASNAFLATKISFINEIANFCDIVSGDVKEVARGIGLDKRIGPKFLQAGVGYGGSCLPKDVRTLIELGRKKKQKFSILEAVEAVNMDQRERLVAKVRHALGGEVKGKTIAIWGLAFKPNTDDVRDAPSITIIERLLAEGATIRAYDPVAMPNAKRIFEQMQGDCAKKTAVKRRKLSLFYAKNAYNAVKGANALILLTEWDEFKNPDWKRLKKLMKGSAIIDGRNLLR
ncbi:UDP-glucose/GDP-mannose dehydrogenase family protein [Candidatus Peregrinibacteria bacterium]|nr:UDP-glucose/GDP-mannose dehydrogenase family protein [Candidatus Peregrinibacteria bacterium]